MSELTQLIRRLRDSNDLCKQEAATSIEGLDRMLTKLFVDWKAEVSIMQLEINSLTRSPLSNTTIDAITDGCFQAVADQGTTVLMRAVARAVERQHGIQLGEQP